MFTGRLYSGEMTTVPGVGFACNVRNDHSSPTAGRLVSPHLFHWSFIMKAATLLCPSPGFCRFCPYSDLISMSRMVRISSNTEAPNLAWASICFSKLLGSRARLVLLYRCLKYGGRSWHMMMVGHSMEYCLACILFW